MCGLLPLGSPADRLHAVLRPIGSRWGVLRQRAAGHRVAQAVAMGGDAGLYGPAEALPQMEPVSDLQGTRGAAAGALGVGARPVPADDLHAGVADQPGGQWSALAGREHVDHAMVFDAGQDRGVGLAATDREVVHAQHPWSTESRISGAGKGAGLADQDFQVVVQVQTDSTATRVPPVLRSSLRSAAPSNPPSKYIWEVTSATPTDQPSSWATHPPRTL